MLLVGPGPRFGHQTVVSDLHLLLRARCPPELQIILAPFTVALSDDTRCSRTCRPPLAAGGRRRVLLVGSTPTCPTCPTCPSATCARKLSTAITLLATVMVNVWTASRRPPYATFLRAVVADVADTVGRATPSMLTVAVPVPGPGRRLLPPDPPGVKMSP